MAGSVGNGSGHDVEYEVEPSDPGGNIVGDTKGATYSLIAGTAAVGVGCLTQIGGRGLVFLGVGLLVLALVFQIRALRGLRTLRREPRARYAAVQRAGGGRTPLPDAQEHDGKNFVAGMSWVVFYNDKEPYQALAMSPPVPDANSRVVLRKYGTPSTLAQPQQLVARTSGEYFVELLGEP
jgi:hypothetical protein